MLANLPKAMLLEQLRNFRNSRNGISAFILSSDNSLINSAAIFLESVAAFLWRE
jgi:hypothetical protein